jgi:transcriptional regulator with XRE-family HTH domain
VETNGAVLTKSSRIFECMFEDENVMKQSIALRIKYQMKKAKISQPELAMVLGCSKDTVFSYVHGKTQEGNMNRDLLKKMAQYFKLDRYYFFNEYLIFIDTTDVPEYLRQMRKKENMSQRKFASKVHIPLSAYKKYETGDARLPERYWQHVKL